MRSRVAAVLIAPFLAVAVATSAHAAPGDVSKSTGEGLSACPSGYLCLYNNPNFNQGAPELILKTNQDIRDLVPLGFDNMATSFYNNSTKIWDAWSDPNFRGSGVHLNPQDTIDLSDTVWDNTTSSVEFH